MARFTAHKAVQKLDELHVLVVKDAETNLAAPFTVDYNNGDLTKIIDWMENGDRGWAWLPAEYYTIEEASL